MKLSRQFLSSFEICLLTIVATIPCLFLIAHLNFQLQSAYAAYFSIRKNYEMYERWPLCLLCEKLHNPNEPWQTYKDAYEWWYLDDQSDFLCENGHSRHYFHSSDDDLIREKLSQIKINRT